MEFGVSAGIFKAWAGIRKWRHTPRRVARATVPALARRMPLSTRSTTLAFAFAATLASCADARSGVGVLVDNREGAFLQSGSEGRDLGATTRATLDPAGAAATAAALLRAAPVAPVDATASAQVRARTIPRLSTPEPGSLLAPRGFLHPTTGSAAGSPDGRARSGPRFQPAPRSCSPPPDPNPIETPTNTNLPSPRLTLLSHLPPSAHLEGAIAVEPRPGSASRRSALASRRRCG